MELRVQNFGLPSVGQRLGLGSRVCHAKSTNPQPYTVPKLGDPHLDLNGICFCRAAKKRHNKGKDKAFQAPPCDLLRLVSLLGRHPHHRWPGKALGRGVESGC